RDLAHRRDRTDQRLQESHGDGQRPRSPDRRDAYRDGGGPMTRISRGRAGFTLIELMVSLVVFIFVMGSALSFLRSQGRAVSLGNDRMDALQNLQFAMTTMEQRLRAAGGDTPDVQPVMIYAGKNVVAFNADYTTNIANDPFAVYYDPDAPAGSV